jgi:hypothetical protein
MKRGAIVFVSGLVLSSAPARGNEVSAVEVMQPFIVSGNLVLGRVTYFGYFGEGATEAAVRLTCEPNIATVSGGVERGDFNEASSSGIALRFLYHESPHKTPGRWPYLFGDTMRVILDASNLKRSSARRMECADTTLVDATIQCLIVNAARYRQVPFLHVAIVGPAELARYGGAFGTEGYRCGPKEAARR